MHGSGLIKSPPLNCTFVPIYDMEDVGVVRQRECPPRFGDSFTNLVYPLKTLQPIRSRVQPEFVIVALGMLLYDLTITTKPLRQKLLAEFPAIKKRFKFYPSETSSKCMVY